MPQDDNEGRAAIEDVRKIAELQGDARLVLNELGDWVESIEAHIARRTQALRKVLRATASRPIAAVIAAALTEHGVDTGSLDAGFTEDMAALGQQVYPTTYPTTKPRWGVVRNA